MDRVIPFSHSTKFFLLGIPNKIIQYAQFGKSLCLFQNMSCPRKSMFG